MYRSVRWWMLSAVLIGGFLTARPAFAATPGVKDHAELFSADAVKAANKEIQEIKDRYQHDLVVETFATIPDSKKAEFEKIKADDAAKNRFFVQWSEER